MAPDRDQLRAMTQKDIESLKEYAQRWREVASQICQPLEEKEMMKIYLKTLSPFYYERMVASVPSDFTEMVNMGVSLEEAVREGRLNKEPESSIGPRKYGSSFQKKMDQDVSNVLHKTKKRFSPQVATVTPVVNSAPAYQPQVSQQPFQQRSQQPQQQVRPPNCNNNQIPRYPAFDPIPMPYAELFPTLLAKGLIQIKSPPNPANESSHWFKADQSLYQICLLAAPLLK